MGYWLFQANPARYDIMGALRELQVIPWSLRQHERDVRLGDGILIWSSGPTGGIVARGIAVSEPAITGVVDDEKPFVLDPSLNAALPAVRVRIDEVFDPPIGRDLAKAHPVLSQMVVFQMPRGTNYPVTSEQWAAAVELSTIRA
jgi:5-methylcytosine-specific restriction enzyme B